MKNEEPKTFAGRVVKKYGKTKENDYPQPEKFFNDAQDFFRILDGAPYSAIEDLEKYEGNREVMINITRRLFKILDAAGISIVDEMRKMDETPFDGLEEDLEAKKAKLKEQIMKGEIGN